MEPVEAERRASKLLHRMSVVGFPQQPEFEELHDRHRFFRVYSVGRTGPAGGGPHLAHALLALFPSGLVANAFASICEQDELERVRSAYVTACEAAGDRLYGDAPDAAELADRLEALVDGCDYADRPLAGAWADVPRPSGVGARIERAATVLREHRGGGHLSVLTAHGLTGPDAHLVTALWRGHEDAESAARFFGWRDGDLEESWVRLRAAGRVDDEGALTEAGRKEREAIEELTTALATTRWSALQAEDRRRLVELLDAVLPAR